MVNKPFVLQWSHCTAPRYGQYLTHAHSHITRAMAATNSCFGPIGPHHHVIAVRFCTTRTLRCRRPLLPWPVVVVIVIVMAIVIYNGGDDDLYDTLLCSVVRRTICQGQSGWRRKP